MHDPAGPGHNARRPAQWQTPHLGDDHEHGHDDRVNDPDLDLVEAAFVEGFRTAPDPTSFLRLANVPMALALPDGRTAHLLRVETEERCDVGAVSQVLGGGHRVRPLPAKLVGRRRQLRFVYQADDDQPVVLDFAAVRAAEPRSIA
jgi:hypothetical protein